MTAGSRCATSPWSTSWAGPTRLVEAAPDTPQSVGEGYVSMADEGGRAIGGAVALLARPDALPAVFHCTAGKDRTGILAAIVLSAVGVRDEDIVANYMLTGESRAARNAYLQLNEPDYYAFLASLPAPLPRDARRCHSHAAGLDAGPARLGHRIPPRRTAWTTTASPR